jgi:hypothetical protein
LIRLAASTGKRQGNRPNRTGGSKERRDGDPMKLAESEEHALKKLRGELFDKYPIIEIRLYGLTEEEIAFVEGKS